MCAKNTELCPENINMWPQDTKLCAQKTQMYPENTYLWPQNGHLCPQNTNLYAQNSVHKKTNHIVRIKYSLCT